MKQDTLSIATAACALWNAGQRENMRLVITDRDVLNAAGNRFLILTHSETYGSINRIIFVRQFFDDHIEPAPEVW